MPVRPTMAQLILKVRQLIGDQNPTCYAFTAQEIQDAFDAKREIRRQVPCTWIQTFEPGTGIAKFYDYYSDYQYWEADAQLFGPAWQPLNEGITPDYITGHWQFSYSQIPNVFVSGKIFDIYGVAADLLDARAAKAMLEFDFSDQQVMYKRQQQFQNMTALAKTYRNQAWPISVNLVRDDVNYDARAPIVDGIVG